MEAEVILVALIIAILAAFGVDPCVGAGPVCVPASQAG